jgi:hypothetical protein
VIRHSAPPTGPDPLANPDGISAECEALVDTVSDLRDLGVEVRLMRVHRTVYDAPERGGMIDRIGPESFSEDLEDVLPPRDRGR